MSDLTGWWVRRSGPARIELYTRWSFHAVALIEVFEIGMPIYLSTAPTPLRLGLFAVVLLHAGLCALLSARAIDWALGRAGQPLGLLVAVFALTAVTAVAAPALRANGYLAYGSDALILLLGVTSFGPAALYLGLRNARRTAYCVLVLAGAAAAATALAGATLFASAGHAVAVLLVGLVSCCMAGCSAWLLGVVWELDAAREAQATLAVAEERLRFGRDLHDVMGRNLAVIALKSELAVQLARRGRPEAVDQMIEVQRIARESQREVGEVVRGYRKADATVELAGALSVLRAAGVDARAEVDDTGGLPPAVQEVLGWVLREATTNVLRHSEAGYCAIRLSMGSSVLLTIENDGVATVPPGAPGSGLVGLRERLAGSGGALTVESQGGVFRLLATVPLPAAAAAPHRAGTVVPHPAAPAAVADVHGVAGTAGVAGVAARSTAEGRTR